MFHSDLYSVIDDLMKRNHESSTECFIELDGGRYNVESKVDADDRPYFMVRLPFDVNNAALQLQHKPYTLNDIHFTVYRNRGGENGIMCPHVTGRYKDVASGENVTLRGYVADGDFVQLNTLRATTSRKNNKKKTITRDLANFFETQTDRQLFTAHVVPYLLPLMVFLRAHQTKLTAPLEQAYTTTLAEIRRLHHSISASADDALIAKRIEVSAILVDITASLSQVSKTHHTWRGLNQWHQQQHDNYLTAKKDFSKTVSGTSEKDSDAVTEAAGISSVVVTSAQLQQQPETMVKSWDVALAEINTLLATVNLNSTEAERLQDLIVQLDKDLMHSDLPIEEQYALLSLMLDAKSHLSQHCFDTLRRGDIDSVRPYVMYLSRIPAHEVEAYLGADKHDVLSFLLENNLLSIYDKSSGGQLLYSLAYEEESLGCISLYATHGVHLFVMASDAFIPLFSDERVNASRLRQVLSQLDRANLHLQRTISASTGVVLGDNLLRSLRATRHDLLEPAKKSRKRTKNPETDATQALGFAISMLEIFHYFSHLFSEEEMKIMGQYAKITSLAPLINLLPKQGVITLNFANIVSILTPIKSVLSKIKTQLNDLSFADRVVLKDLMMGAAEGFPDTEAGQKAAAADALIKVIQGLYEMAYQDMSPAVRGKARRHQLAVQSILDLFTIQTSVFGKIGLPPVEFSCALRMGVTRLGMVDYTDVEQLRAFVEGILSQEKTKLEQVRAFILEKCHISDSDMDAIICAIGAIPSGTGIFTVEPVPEAISIQALNSLTGPGSFKAKNTAETGGARGFLSEAKKEDGEQMKMG